MILEPSVAIAMCRKTCFPPQIVLLQYKAKPYPGFQNLECHCKIIGCHFDTQKRLKKSLHQSTCLATKIRHVIVWREALQQRRYFRLRTGCSFGFFQLLFSAYFGRNRPAYDYFAFLLPRIKMTTSRICSFLW